MNDAKLRSALALAARGWPVFPCKGKVPLTERGHNDASTDPDVIKSGWLEDFPGANIGVALPADVVVVDVDPRNGGTESLDRLEAEHGKLPDTLACETGGGGIHFYFAKGPALKLPKALAAGIDLKSKGGYVIAPPSDHASGNLYAWINEGAELAPLPEWIAAVAAREPERAPEPAAPSVSVSASDDYDADVAALAALLRPHWQEGRRNELRLRASGMLKHAGWHQDAAERLLVEVLKPEDGDERKARAAVAASYTTATPTGFQKFSEVLGDRRTAENVRAIAYSRRDELDRQFKVPEDEPSEPKGETDPGYLDVFAVLPNVPYVVRGLDLAPGAPTIIAGFGFSGKTIAAQSALVSLAAGRPVWGLFDGKRGAVKHLDYEQGAFLTAQRYQRLARGAGLWVPELRDTLRVRVAPRTLDREGAEDWLVQEATGQSVVLVDSFRAAWPSIDENSSEARVPLDMLFRVSERTGAAFVVIHHAGKKATDKGQRERLRGSSAIFDACQSVLLFEPTSDEPGAPIRVTQAKARLSGTPARPFELVIGDVSEGIEPRWGLDVRASSAVPREEQKLTKVKLAVLETISRAPTQYTSKTSLREAVGGTASIAGQAIAQLIAAGYIGGPPFVLNAKGEQALASGSLF